jgi:hypothetical protein
MEIPSSIIVTGVIFVLLFALFLYFLFGGKIPFASDIGVDNGDSSNSQFSPISQWSSPENVSNAVCKGYKFPSTSRCVPEGESCGGSSSRGKTIISLGTPSLTRLNDIVPCGSKPPLGSEDCIYVQETPYYCIDEDQINAVKQFHTCDRTIVDGENVYDYPTDTVLCTKMDGTKANYGETETFFSNCREDGGKTPRYCTGQVGSVSIGFSQSQNCDGQRFNCLSKSGDNIEKATLETAICDLSKDSQQFRIILDDGKSGQASTSDEMGTGLSGNKMRIEVRNSCNSDGSGCQCVYPENTGDIDAELKFDDCERDSFKGFVWAIIPSTNFPDDIYCTDDDKLSQDQKNDCIDSLNADAYDSCISSCKKNCKNQMKNCESGCGIDPENQPPNNCDLEPEPGSDSNEKRDNDYEKCIENSPSGFSCQYCILDTCSNKADCYATCSNILNQKEHSNIYSSDQSPSQQQIIYIGNATSYSEKIPTNDPYALYDYITNNKARSLYQDTNNNKFVLKKYNIGPKYKTDNKCSGPQKCTDNASCADYVSRDWSGIVVSFPLFNTFSNLVPSSTCNCGNEFGSCKNCSDPYK